MLHLPQNLRLIRELSGKTQIEFARIFDLKDRNGAPSKDKVWTYENGKAAPPELALKKIAAWAGVSVEALKGKALDEKHIHFSELPAEDTKKPSPVEGEGFKDKYLSSLEKIIERQEKIISSLEHRLTEVERKLSEIKHNQRISYSFQLAFQEYWVEHFQTENGNREAAEAKIGRIAFSHLQRLPEEGSLL